MQSRVWKWCSGSAVALALALAQVAAEPLPKETCDTIKSEQDTLAAVGIADDLAKGPQWAKANLPRERLAQIARYITLEEQLLFRCDLAKLKSVLPPDEEDATAQAAATPPATAAIAPPVAPKPKPKPKPKVTEVVQPAPAEPAAAEAAPTEKPKIRRPRTTEAQAAPAQPPEPAPAKPKVSKPRVDDAYRPPAANPSADPFAKQLAPAR